MRPTFRPDFKIKQFKHLPMSGLKWEKPETPGITLSTEESD